MNVKENPNPLRILRHFLNLDLARVDPKNLLKVSSVQEHRAAPNTKPSLVLCLILAPDARQPWRLQMLQEVMREDLAKILEPRSIPLGASVPWKDISPAGFWLFSLVQKIDRMQLRSGRRVIPVRDLRRDFHPFAQPLELDTEELAVVESGWGATAEENLYKILDSALRDRSFQSLKQCPTCGCFFIARDPRKRFHTKRCKDDFHNRRRQDEGYFAEKQRDRRRKKKENLLIKKKQVRMMKKKRQLRSAMQLLIDAAGRHTPSAEPIAKAMKALGAGDFPRGRQVIADWGKNGLDRATSSLTPIQKDILLDLSKATH